MVVRSTLSQIWTLSRNHGYSWGSDMKKHVLSLPPTRKGRKLRKPHKIWHDPRVTPPKDYDVFNHDKNVIVATDEVWPFDTPPARRIIDGRPIGSPRAIPLSLEARIRGKTHWLGLRKRVWLAFDWSYEAWGMGKFDHSDLDWASGPNDVACHHLYSELCYRVPYYQIED